MLVPRPPACFSFFCLYLVVLVSEVWTACVVAQSRIEHLFAKAKGSEKGAVPFFTHYGEVTDLNNLVRVFVCFLCLLFVWKVCVWSLSHEQGKVQEEDSGTAG